MKTKRTAEDAELAKSTVPMKKVKEAKELPPTNTAWYYTGDETPQHLFEMCMKFRVMIVKASEIDAYDIGGSAARNSSMGWAMFAAQIAQCDIGIEQNNRKKVVIENLNTPLLTRRTVYAHQMLPQKYATVIAHMIRCSSGNWTQGTNQAGETRPTCFFTGKQPKGDEGRRMNYIDVQNGHARLR